VHLLPLDELAALRQYAPMDCGVAFKKIHAPCMKLDARVKYGAG
jgi:hypothetical protein